MRIFLFTIPNPFDWECLRSNEMLFNVFVRCSFFSCCISRWIHIPVTHGATRLTAKCDSNLTGCTRWAAHEHEQHATLDVRCMDGCGRILQANHPSTTWSQNLWSNRIHAIRMHYYNTEKNTHTHKHTKCHTQHADSMLWEAVYVALVKVIASCDNNHR